MEPAQERLELAPPSSFTNSAKRKHSQIETQNGTAINVANLQVVRNLGEGAYGVVMLVIDRQNPEFAMAVKCVDLRKHVDVKEAVRKEALLQRTLRNHENVLKYISMRVNDEDQFQLFLEYADGGELFDQIEPDVGMPPSRACFYFKQLMDGLEYIHSKGIAHRDIKPENLLLTKKDVLKISDFGMATIFQHDGRERYLNTKCGTVPYAAPEIFTGRYRGSPIDVWSSGVVLVTLLTGELPWEQPYDDCELYQNWVHARDFTRRPWSKIGTHELSLLKAMLCVDVEKRASVRRIKTHPWFIRYGPKSAPGNPVGDSVFKRPPKRPRMECNIITKIDGGAIPGISFTQPENADALLLTTQFAASQAVSQVYHVNALQKLVRRMTRFCVTVTVPEAVKAVEGACSQLGYTARQITAHQLMLSSSCGKRDLSFLVTVYEMHDINCKKVLVDFRRSKGDGLEFKRMFLSLRNELAQIVCKDSSGWLEMQGLICSQRLDALHLSDDMGSALGTN
ncbi:Protein CHK-1 a [Aphelenchoides avenae]|nr:Protein CHK-1 a [Aphelenchus avenae]